MNKIILIVAILFSQAARAQNISQGMSADSVPPPKDSLEHVKWYKTNAFKVGAFPVVLIGYSLTIMKDNGLYSSYDARDYAREHYPNFHTTADNYLQFFPAVIVYGLDLAGVKSRNNWVDQTLIIGISQALNGVLTTATKDLTHVERPDGSNDLSFPSGHTSFSFVMAEVVHQEFKEKSVWISVAGYSVATTVGAMRILNNKHWLSDVVAGAGFGILSAKLTYLVYPKIQKKFGGKGAKGL